MRPTQIEALVLQTIDRVRAGSKVEDSRVELKAAWPEPYDAARRVAGHVNASHGEPVLWIIGLDERAGVVQLAPVETHEWMAQVARHFDGAHPSYTDIVVHTSAGSVVALLFDASRSPFVVKSAVFGKPGGGPIQREVPWREGSAVRSAKREDLIRILSPLAVRPEVEVLTASANRSVAVGPPASDNNVIIEAHLYIVPMESPRIVIPFHRISGAVSDLDGAHSVSLGRAEGTNLLLLADPNTTTSPPFSELTIDSPRRAVLTLPVRWNFGVGGSVRGFRVHVELRTLPGDLATSVDFELLKQPRTALDVSVWTLRQPGDA